MLKHSVLKHSVEKRLGREKKREGKEKDDGGKKETRENLEKGKASEGKDAHYVEKEVDQHRKALVARGRRSEGGGTDDVS